MIIKFENPTNQRYFYINVHTDALGDIALTIIRGGLHNRVVVTKGYNDLQRIEKEIERLTKRRIARGYVKVN